MSNIELEISSPNNFCLPYIAYSIEISNIAYRIGLSKIAYCIDILNIDYRIELSSIAYRIIYGEIWAWRIDRNNSRWCFPHWTSTVVSNYKISSVEYLYPSNFRAWGIAYRIEISKKSRIVSKYRIHRVPYRNIEHTVSYRIMENRISSRIEYRIEITSVERCSEKKSERFFPLNIQFCSTKWGSIMKIDRNSFRFSNIVSE